jgi:hypothetical protein
VVATRKKSWRLDGHKLDRQRDWLGVFQKAVYLICQLGASEMPWLRSARSNAVIPCWQTAPSFRRCASLRVAPGLSFIERRAVMVQSLTERPTEAAAHAALRADHLERDREAWNLPRASVETVSFGAHRDRLDWDGFRDLYYPDSRRHNLNAIVAYGAYKRSPRAGPQPASEAAHLTTDAGSIEALPVEEWEDEGGASH